MAFMGIVAVSRLWLPTADEEREETLINGLPRPDDLPVSSSNEANIPPSQYPLSMGSLAQ